LPVDFVAKSASLLSAETDFKHEVGIARMVVMGVVPTTNALGDIFHALEHGGIEVLMITYEPNAYGLCDLSIALQEEQVRATRVIIESLDDTVRYQALVEERGLARISMVRSGEFSRSQTVAYLLGALKQAEVSVSMLSVSEMKISCVIEDRLLSPALQSLRGQ